MRLIDWLTVLIVEIFLVMYFASNFDSVSQLLAQLTPF